MEAKLYFSFSIYVRGDLCKPTNRQNFSVKLTELILCICSTYGG